MRPPRLLYSSLLVCAALAGCNGCGGSDACDEAALRGRIASLSSGEALSLGSCVLHGSVTIPAGATVTDGAYVLAGDDVLTLTPGTDAAPTTLSGAQITGGAHVVNVLASGSGAVRIESCTLELSSGIGIGVSGASATLVDVHVTGNVDPAHILDVPVPAPADRFATYGVAAVEGAHVAVGGSFTTLASAGVVCSDATLSLTDVLMDQNRGFGLEAFACTIDASRVEVTRTLTAPGLVGMGFALAQSSTLQTGVDLHFHDAPGFGVFASGSDVALSGPTVERLEQAGVWLEDGGTLRIEDGTFDDNRGMAIAAIGATRLEVARTMVTNTRSAHLLRDDGVTTIPVGDAIHVAQLTERATEVSIADVTLVDNTRVGLVLDGGGSTLALTVERTSVQGMDTELGAIAQNVAALPVGWDSGVSRMGSPATLDASAALLDVSDGSGVGVLMPPTISF